MKLIVASFILSGLMTSAALAAVARTTTGHLIGHEERAGSRTVVRLHPSRIASTLDRAIGKQRPNQGPGANKGGRLCQPAVEIIE